MKTKKRGHIICIIFYSMIWFLFTGGHSTFFALLNSFVHIVMYFYYMIAAMGPKYQKYIWWKKYLTSFQMVNNNKKNQFSFIQGPPNIFFVVNALKKKLQNIFSNFFFFYWKVQYFRLIMENNFIQIAASAGHAVAYTIGPIFKHIIDCVQLYSYFTNGFTNILL